MPHHDLVIIGSGSGNTVLTPELEGLDVAIVEGGTFGGTCVNVGCIPSKMLVLPGPTAADRMPSRSTPPTPASPARDGWRSPPARS